MLGTNLSHLYSDSERESPKIRICNNMQNICTDLHNTAEKKMQEIFSIHPSTALNTYKRLYGKWKN